MTLSCPSCSMLFDLLVFTLFSLCDGRLAGRREGVLGVMGGRAKKVKLGHGDLKDKLT